MTINISDYSILKKYAVLAYTGLSTINTTTITSPFLYGSVPPPSYTGTFIGTSDSVNAVTAQMQLTVLVNAINSIPVSEIISGGSGTITYTPGRYNSPSTITYSSGTEIILDAQGNNNAQFFITSDDGIKLESVSSITLINGASNCNIYWLAGSDIKFTGTSPSSIPGIFIAETKIKFDNASQVLGRLYAQTENIEFSGTSSVDAECYIVCYAKGTLILTKKGFIPIENIKAGDKVLTKGKIYNNKNYVKNDPQIEPVVWISKFKVKGLDSKSRPICIKKDAIRENYPFQDLYVSPGHRLLLNGKMVLAKNIVNGKTIYQDNECDNVEYYHLECENHSAIIANGVLAESYFNDNNRYVFENSIRLRRKISLNKIQHLR